MSDIPPPPGGSPPPPPPPPSAPPPPPGAEFGAYTPTNWSQGLSRVKPFALWISVMLAVTAAGTVLSLLTVGQARDAAQDFLNGSLDGDEFTDKVTGSAGGGMIAGAANLALIVLSIMWLFRIVRNHVRLGLSVRWTPGWAIGGWFLPPFFFVIPTLILRESWSASAPGGTSRSENPWIWVWFALYSVPTVVFLALGVSQLSTMTNNDNESLAEYYVDSHGNLIVQGILTILAAAAWFMVVRTLTERHVALTGESSTR